MRKQASDKELIEAFAIGIEEQRHTTVAAQSKNFVVFKVKGHSAWSGVACPWEYVRAQHILIRKGDHWMSGSKPQRKWEGRVSPTVLREALRRSEMLKQVYDGNLDAPMCEECNEEMNYGEGVEGNKPVAYYRCDECGWSVDA